MINILIVGSGSYIGVNLSTWLGKSSQEYKVDTIGTLLGEFKDKSFDGYDSIVHVAGIAHVSNDSALDGLYKKVNTDLAIDVAKKAKKSGASQFIFMSSIIIYGDDLLVGDENVISPKTIPAPANVYSNSKYLAEQGLKKLGCDDFHIAIIRTPMVYGKNCRGNFPKLLKYGKYLGLVPNIFNQRSMIYVELLCEFIRVLVTRNSDGYFYPQNNGYMVTNNVVKVTREIRGKRTYNIKGVAWFLRLIGKKVSIINRIYSNKVYLYDSITQELLDECVNYETNIDETIINSI